jgi:hypothetical protein
VGTVKIGAVEQELITTVVAGQKLAALRGVRRKSFVQQYRNDPVAFVHDCFAWDPANRNRNGPTPYQEEILAGLLVNPRQSVRGPHGLGKTALASWCVHWFVQTRDGEEDWKLPTTASSWRQLTHYLWPEIKKWAKLLRWDKLARDPYDPRSELLQLNIKGKTGEAFAVASTTPELIEGAHADAMFYIFDESKAIPDTIFDAAEGAFSGAGQHTGRDAFALCISTPGLPSGRFYDIQTRKPGYESWGVRAVTFEETVEAGRNDEDWRQERKRQWGERSSVYINRVLGDFAADDEEGVIPLSWVEAAIERGKALEETPAGPLTAVGVDVADTGDDDSVLARRHGLRILPLSYFHGEDTMQVTGRISVALILIAEDRPTAVVDVIGIGAGVVARLRELGHRVLPFNASERATGHDVTGELLFLNKRSHAWWHLRELLNPANGHELALPDDPRLIGDLTAPRWSVMSGGKVKIESKDEIRKRLGRSTDAADAVIHACYSDFGDVLDFSGVNLVTLPKTSLWRL